MVISVGTLLAGSVIVAYDVLDGKVVEVLPFSVTFTKGTSLVSSVTAFETEDVRIFVVVGWVNETGDEGRVVDVWVVGWVLTDSVVDRVVVVECPVVFSWLVNVVEGWVNEFFVSGWLDVVVVSKVVVVAGLVVDAVVGRLVVVGLVVVLACWIVVAGCGVVVLISCEVDGVAGWFVEVIKESITVVIGKEVVVFVVC